ncbi:hypothetical protein PILCRDRAFT_5374 [Piloderma croceum F 1598]|uniref:CCHC-type domain-containing protein n=1 Tax=Piloderma croceum (strain F 1598) TaxID=765440 RepID=A0A0C3BHD8_PILCF|nr:hypothetical protein PILCRDRAFT_5374 [Piloderma croceum F 1598]
MASRMIERPSDYSFRLRLYEGLPAWIYDTLLERNILPEFCTLEDIRENAQQIEELSLRARGNFRGSSATSLLKRPQNEPQRSHSSMKPRASASGGFKPFQPNNNIRSSGERPSDIRPNNVRTFNRPNPTTGRNNIQPSRGQSHSSGSLRQVKPGAPRVDQGPRDNKLVECYRCHQIGHIATDTKCPQHPSKMGRPRFNAQRLIEDEAEGEEDVQEEHPEDHDDLQDVNSWGGSQYDPEDEGDRFEEEPAEDEGHKEEEDIEQDKVCMSSMRTVRMYTMRRIREEGEIEDLAIFSRIAEPPIPDIEDVVHHVEGSDFNAGSSTNNNNTAPDPTREIEREEPPIDGSSNANDSIHSHLFDEDIPIADPVYIEYRDGLVFRVQLDDDWEAFSEILTENARCYICHQCRPTVRQVIFTGQHSGDEYYYLLWTCHTPVERTRAEADIDDDESAFEISRFFANRIISESLDNNPENFVMVNGYDSDEEGEESDEEEIPDLVGIIEGDENWHRATSMEVLSPITLAHMDERAIMEQDFICGNTHCSECGECRPRIVADYRTPRNPPGVTRHLRAICMNSGTNMAVRPGLQDIILEGALLPRVPEQQISTEAAIEDHMDSEDEEWREHMAHHHHTPPECPYCHNCRPIIEEVYYMAADGEVFYRDRLICQSDTTTTEASGSNTRLQAMRMVYSSNV